MKYLIVALLTMLSTTSAFAGNIFDHKYIKLDLPEGWTAYPAAEADLPHAGTIKSTSIAGTSITMECYRGVLHALSSTRIRGLGLIAAAYPAGQEQVKTKAKISTKDGKGIWETWRGYVQVGNQKVALISPMAMIQTPDCWLVMIGYTAEASAEQLEKDFLTIVESAR